MYEFPYPCTMAALVGWSEENMKKAIEAVNNNSMRQKQAEFAFRVPKSSFNDRMHEKQSGENGLDTLLRQLMKLYWWQ